MLLKNKSSKLDDKMDGQRCKKTPRFDMMEPLATHRTSDSTTTLPNSILQKKKKKKKKKKKPTNQPRLSPSPIRRSHSPLLGWSPLICLGQSIIRFFSNLHNYAPTFFLNLLILPISSLPSGDSLTGATLFHGGST